MSAPALIVIANLRAADRARLLITAETRRTDEVTARLAAREHALQAREAEIAKSFRSGRR